MVVIVQNSKFLTSEVSGVKTNQNQKTQQKTKQAKNKTIKNPKPTNSQNTKPTKKSRTTKLKIHQNFKAVTNNYKLSCNFSSLSIILRDVPIYKTGSWIRWLL